MRISRSEGKNRRGRRIGLLLLMLALFTVGTIVLNYCLIPYQYTRQKLHCLETTAYDDVVLGTSHAASALDPAVIAEVTGASCFNAAVGGFYANDNEMLLRYICRYQKPKRVIYEFDPSYWTEPLGPNNHEQYLLSCMKPSLFQMRSFLSCAWNNDFRFTFLPWYLYKDEIRRIRTTIAVKRSADYREYGVEAFRESGQTYRADGFVAIHDDTGLTGTITQADVDTLPAKPSFSEKDIEKSRAAFISMAEFCREEGIELVVVTTPVPEITKEQNGAFYEAAHKEMEELSKTYGFSYYDYTQEPSGLTDAAFSDADGHMHESAAAAFSKTFAEEME